MMSSASLAYHICCVVSGLTSPDPELKNLAIGVDFHLSSPRVAPDIAERSTLVLSMAAMSMGASFKPPWKPIEGSRPKSFGRYPGVAGPLLLGPCPGVKLIPFGGVGWFEEELLQLCACILLLPSGEG